MDPSHRQGRRISLLVVEDDPDQAFIIGKRLKESGFSVRRATTGKEALASLDGIDLVLMDYRLPDMTGLDVLEQIRARNGPSVVMVTGMGSEEIAVDAMRAGAIDYVVKDAAYLRMIPEVVERAWRTHDLERRASEFERMILLVNEATDREATFHEIVSGAKKLLGANDCALFVRDDGARLEVAATTGETDAVVTSHLSRAAGVLTTAETTAAAPGTLLVPLSKEGDEPLGVLLVQSDEDRVYPPEELKLAEAFASFAGIALRNLRRQELEQALIAELQQAMELRRDFVNSVSHELRTPLACISGFSTTVLNHWGRLDEDTMRTSVEKIRHHASDLADLVEALLDFGAMERGGFKPHIEPLDLRAQVEQTIGGLQPLLAERLVQVDVPGVKVLGDPRLVRRAVANLLSNAVKWSGPDTKIFVRAHVHDGAVRVEVEDQGVGLDPQEIEQVFRPFWRSRGAVKAAARGTGMGLTLVREYVRSMGGEVGVESEPGKGSTFYFTLSLHQPTTQ